MKKERWFLFCSVNITGFNGCYETNTDEEINIPLYADNQKDAEKEAMRWAKTFKEAAEEIDWEFFKQFSNTIEEEDGLGFSNFRLVSVEKGSKFEKKLDIKVPRLVGGP